MSTYFVARSVKPGDSIHYSDLESAPRLHGYGGPLEDPIDLPLTTIDLACGGDYAGSGAVEASNHRVMLADADIAPSLVTISGSHGYFGVGYLGALVDQPEALRDAIAALDQYPILSDDDHGDLESSLEAEAWDDHGRSDFRRALVAVLDHIDPDHEHDTEDIDDDVIDQMWYDGCDAFNVNGGSGYTIETGDSVHFYIDEWCDGATEAEHLVYRWSDWSRAARRDLHERLTTLAIATRIPEDGDA